MSFWTFVPLILIASFFVSCTQTIRVIQRPETPEENYCTTNTVFPTPITISGSAIYKKRKTTWYGLGGVDPTDYPIRKAEVQILDSSGNIVQCAETDTSGNFSFTIENDSANYTVKVNSRSDNTANKASVLNNPTNNQYYSISTTFISDVAKNVGTLSASHTGDVVGAAFNILDQIYNANYYLLNNSAGTFTVSEKVQAYWAKGANPVTYFDGDPSSGVSFYVPGTDKLYILGGIDGDVATSDTDHFDDSVILHEYGHFVEDNYSDSDSPGGTHYGIYIIDPRLAWSEGFANFFQAAVTGSEFYLDTYGYNDSDGSAGTGFGYYYNIETNNNQSNQPLDNPASTPAMDRPGEGAFREFAVTRFLWDAIDTHPLPAPKFPSHTADDGDPIQITFSEFWSFYSGDFKNTLPFREMSLLLEIQDASAGATNISALYDDADKEMEPTRLHYAFEDNVITTNSATTAACRWTIEAQNIAAGLTENGSFARSNQFKSNDFFYYYHSGGTLTVNLAYDLTAATNADLDLYIYNDNYSYGDSSDMLSYSADDNSGASDDNGTEDISITAAAGHYLINVMYYTGDGSPYDPTLYNLTINGNLICR